MLILGIETSCDETAASVVEDGRRILSNIVFSQVSFHKPYGGIVPEIASRSHLEAINAVIACAMEEASCTYGDTDLVAVTCGPGLVGSLLMGITSAKSLAYVHDIPLVAVNHLEGHIFSSFLCHRKINFPFLALVVSGGHSDLVYVKEYGDYEILGRARDDAAGEAFDKVAKFLGLGYPGGPVIDSLAREGRNVIKFPHSRMKDASSLDFSFSGIKTAVVNYVGERPHCRKADLVASFQKALVEMLLERIIAGAKRKGTKRVVIGGGVACNSYFRERLDELSRREGLQIFYPVPALCTDNAAMIAAAAYYRHGRHKLKLKPFSSIKAEPNMELS